MVIAVVSPQGCLPPAHNRQHSFLSSARSETSGKFLHAVMVPSHVPQDCASRTHSGGSTLGDGILPVPLVDHEAQAKKSSSSKMSCTSASTSSPRMFRKPSSLGLNAKRIRPASAILPTPWAMSLPLEEGLLRGRLPFKVVQGNGVGDVSDRFQASALKKASKQRHRVGKKPVLSQNHVSNTTPDGKLERSKSMSKMLYEDGAVFGGQSKETTVRINSKSKRRRSVRCACEKEQVIADFPLVTILRRPKMDEGAVKLHTDFFQSRTQQELQRTVEGSAAMPEKSDSFCAMVGGEETETDSNIAEFPGSGSDEVNSRNGVSPKSSRCPNRGAELKKSLLEPALEDAGNIAAALEVGMLADLYSVPLYGSKSSIWGGGCEELAPWERWAGPSFINSPPPSALPLPRFSRRLEGCGIQR